MSLTFLWVLARLMRAEMALTWAERAQAELGAARRFRELSVRLKEVDAHPRILELVKQAEEEEDHHAFLCAKMAQKLGHKTGFAKIEGISEPISCRWDALTSERDRLLLDVVLMSCITESMNASLLNAIYTHSSHSEAGRLIHKILKDEVKHAQIGWAYLSEECKQRDCSFVANYLVDMVTLSVRDELFLPITASITDDSSEASYEYGVMPQHLRLKHFKTTLHQVVCPGFEHFGIDTSALVHLWES